MVVDARGRILGIREKFDRSQRFTTPGGHVDEGEGCVAAAVREAHEEAGVTAIPLGILAFREKLHIIPNGQQPSPEAIAQLSEADKQKYYQTTRFGKTHIGIHVLCAAVSDRIDFDANEVAECKWLSLQEWQDKGHSHIALIMTAAEEQGLLASAAEVARELEARRTPAAATPAEAVAAAAHHSSVAWPGLLQFSLTTAAPPSGSASAADRVAATYFTAMPPSALDKAAERMRHKVSLSVARPFVAPAASAVASAAAARAAKAFQTPTVARNSLAVGVVVGLIVGVALGFAGGHRR